MNSRNAHMDFDNWSDVQSKINLQNYVSLLHQWVQQISDGVSQCNNSQSDPNYLIWKFQFQCILFVSYVLKKTLPVKLKIIDVKRMTRNNLFNVDLAEHCKWGQRLIKHFLQNTDSFDQWWDQKTSEINKKMDPVLMRLMKLCLQHVMFCNVNHIRTKKSLTTKYVCVCPMYFYVMYW